VAVLKVRQDFVGSFFDHAVIQREHVKPSRVILVERAETEPRDRAI